MLAVSISKHNGICLSVRLSVCLIGAALGMTVQERHAVQPSYISI